jgi:hypothetical protein
MLDLPTRSVLVGGLERWEMRQGAFKPIEEQRLAKMLERMLKETGRFDEGRSLSLRTPPLAGDVFNREPPCVAVTVFPTWFVCAASRQTSADAKSDGDGWYRGRTSIRPKAGGATCSTTERRSR